MFERHIYNDDFFKFIKDITTCIDIPENDKLIYEHYKEIPAENV